MKVTNPFFLTVCASIVTGEWLDLKHFKIELFFLMHSAFHKYIFFMFLKCDIIFLNNNKKNYGFCSLKKSFITGNSLSGFFSCRKLENNINVSPLSIQT